MTSLDAANAQTTDDTHGEQDLGPLAWVLDELRKSLDGAVKALRRFVHDAELARDSDLAALDAGPLRMARQQLHQASGALEMVGMESPALVLRAMETTVQKFVQRPELCTEDAAGILERASFALNEYLENVLAGKSVSPVTLFPQYRDVQTLAGVTRVHPADLWPVERRFREPALDVTAAPLAYGPPARARLDQAVLKIVKEGDLAAARDMRDTCLGFVAGQTDRRARAFWKVGAGFFEAFSLGLFTPDVYVKRAASRILMQYASLAKGDVEFADRLVQDLLFFCSQARPAPPGQAPALDAVRRAFLLERFSPVDYEARRFGRFDPAVLAQARKRIAAATETWSTLAGGDRNKLKPAADQFSLVCDSLRKLHRNSESLAQALARAVELTVRSGEPPSAALAMEVATSVLYLQAVLEELDTSDEQMTSRAQRLAQRLESVCSGAEPDPLELWMEDLYRRVSDHQTMGSVVSELRATLGEAERAMDQFFRSPQETALLAVVPGHLAQMRGVLSVLGLDQASLAVVRMRDMVERLLINEISDEAVRHQIFEKLANSLGALGFLIDMLSYQRALARKLFVYDEELGELRVLMGRVRAHAAEEAEETEEAEEAEEAQEMAPALEETMLQPLPEMPPPECLPTAAASLDLDFGLDLDLSFELPARADAPASPASPATPAATAPTPAAPVAPQPQDSAVAPVALAPAQALAPAEPATAVPAPAPLAMAPAAVPMPAPVAPAAAAAAPPPLFEIDDELREIFLEEVREVVANGLAAVEALKDNPGELSEQTTLRRAFHTLKGSSRMVGLNDFGEAGWAMEQLLNAWLAEQKPMEPALLHVAQSALHGFGRWADDIAGGDASAWQPAAFSRVADAMRLEGKELPFELPAPRGEAPAVPPMPEPAPGLDFPAIPAAAPEVEQGPGDMPADFAPSEGTPLPLPLAEEALPAFDFTNAALPQEVLAAPLVADEIDFSEFSAALAAQSPEPAPDTAAEPPAAHLPQDDFEFALTAEEAPPVDFEPAADPSDPDSLLKFFEFDLPEMAPVAATGGAPVMSQDELAALEAGEAAEVARAAEAERVLQAAEAAQEAQEAQEAQAARDAETALQAERAEATRLLDAAEAAEMARAAEAAQALQAAEAAQAAKVAEEAQATRDAEAAMQAEMAEATRLLEAAEVVRAAEAVRVLQAAQAARAAEVADAEDAVKVIGSLRIGIPLYNVYLNEADEWSRMLVTSLQEWSLELHRPLPDTAVALAHSLAGSSATVGFNALSETARLLEHALNHVQLQAQGLPEQVAVFMAAAEDIRRLLHQFAAGFLKESNPVLLEELRQILQVEIDTTLSPAFDDMHYRFAAEASPRFAPVPIAAKTALPDAPVEAPVEAPLPDLVAPALSPECATPAVPEPEPEPEPVPALDSAMAAAAPAVPNAPAAPNVDDDIDVFDVIDPDLFPFFEEEAIELLPRLGSAMRQWTARPENMGARNEVLRALHTVKGSARLAGAMRLGEMSHRLESSIEALDAETVQTAQLEPLLSRFDDLQMNFDALRSISAQDLAAPVVVQPIAPPALETAASAAPAVAQPLMARAKEVLPVVPLRAAAGQSVRVRAQLLDRLINQSGEVLITRSRMDARMKQIKGSMADLSGNLDRLRQHLRDIELSSESQMQSRLALSKDTVAGFDPLEFDRFTQVQEMTRMMAESVNDVATVQRNLQRAIDGTEDDLIAQGRQARELQRDLLHTRMVEFEGISERLYAVVRQSSKELGKQIKLDITGGSIEMDRGVLDRMTPAFEHLLRNCVAHGIETPQERQVAGKPATGSITIALRHEGNDVSVEFTDDGAGLNVARIRAKALAQGLIAPDAVIGNAEAANLIFMPGFTTADQVTGLSGRGVGMDVVRSEINALGGRIETTSQEGQGMAFRMVLPLTTAVTQVVMLRAATLSVGVPAHLIEVVRRVPVAEIHEAYRTGRFDVGGEQVPFYWAGGLLQASLASTEGVGKTRPVVVFRSASQRIAMHVDEVLGNQEVVVKNLGPQLSRLPGLAGMSVLASGAVVLIYNPVALSTVYGEQVRVAGKAALAAAQEAAAQAVAAPAQVAAALAPATRLAGQVPLVLVVDDSITVRRVTQRLLQREGYRVALAADGLQAIERLQEERPTVVLSDIEMPRMDGFDLARNIRSDVKLAGLPIIMITSRIAEKHRQHAMELGANHYLGKPYSDEELLSLIRHYAELEAATIEA